MMIQSLNFLNLYLGNEIKNRPGGGSGEYELLEIEDRGLKEFIWNGFTNKTIR